MTLYLFATVKQWDIGIMLVGVGGEQTQTHVCRDNTSFVETKV